MISARDLIWVLRFPLQEVSDWISLARPFHLDYGAVAEVSLYLAGGSCEASHSSIHPSAWKKSNSTKFAVARSSSRSPLGGIGVGLRGGFGTNWHHTGRICGEGSWRAGTGCCVPTSWEFYELLLGESQLTTGQAQLDPSVA